MATSINKSKLVQLFNKNKLFDLSLKLIEPHTTNYNQILKVSVHIYCEYLQYIKLFVYLVSY